MSDQVRVMRHGRAVNIPTQAPMVVEVGVRGIPGGRGQKGDPFTFADFTLEQIESLKVKGDKGDAFTFEDFTPEQIESLKIKGDKGDTGDAPVRGVDYWTEGDKAEICSYIDQQLGVIENGTY